MMSPQRHPPVKGKLLQDDLKRFERRAMDPSSRRLPADNPGEINFHGELVLYGEHIQTVKYRHPENFAPK
jgi:hypothetical protein